MARYAGQAPGAGSGLQQATGDDMAGRPGTRSEADWPASGPEADWPAARPGADWPAARPGADWPPARPEAGWPAARPEAGWPAARPEAGWPDSGGGNPAGDRAAYLGAEGRDPAAEAEPDAGWATAPPNLVRGFPPAPGEPVPQYQAPFTAWNREPRPADAPMPAGPALEGQVLTPGSAAGGPAPGGPPGTSKPVAAESVGTGDAAWPAGPAQPTDTDRAAAAADASWQAAAADPGSPAQGRAAQRQGGRRRRAGPSAALPPTPDQPGPPGTGRRTARRATGRPQVRLAVGAAVLIIAAAVGYLAVGLGSQPPRHQTGTRPGSRASAPPPVPSLPPWGHIVTRSTDRTPLAAAELFPGTFTGTGGPYQRTASRQSTDCTAALVGPALQAAARRAGCSQVVRASYLSAQAGAMGTIGVLNLDSYQAAASTGRAAGPASYIALLKGAHGPTRRLGGGTGLEEAVVKGHYVILVWAEFTNLQGPGSGAQRTALEQFMNELVQQTANTALSYRLVNGKPSPPG